MTKADRQAFDLPHGIQLILARIDKLPTHLLPEEAAAISHVSAKRQREFAAGRSLARQMLASLQIPAGPIMSSEHRYPEWPDQVVGSISHTTEWVAVMLARSMDIRGLGVDIECRQSVAPALRDTVLTAAELKTRAAAGPNMSDETLWFSAKEAVFKAVNPVCHEFIDFSDVELTFDGDAFVAKTRLANRSTALIESGQGRIWRTDDLVVSAFWVL